MGYDIAIAGATGAVGREMLQTLAERNFPADKVYALASEGSAGRQISYGEDQELTVEALKGFDFSKVDIALFSAGGDLSKEFSPKAGAAGAVVIDNSSAFRMEDDVPLVVPEVNADVLDGFLKDNKRRNIIANPNCSTAQMVVALKPLHEEFVIKRVVVSTYQAVSGAGKNAMDELFNQTRSVYINEPARQEEFTKEIAFNAIPHIDDFMDNGFTREEWKMTEETKKILDPAIDVVAHCVRIPVFIGHSEAVFIECEKPMDEARARKVLDDFDGVVVVDHRIDEGYVTPKESAGEDPVYISRMRQDHTVESGLVFWCVADNLRKGAALNAVQIAEELVKRGL
jgi:aspartate-semialdehyde dehydrogenase